MIDDPLDDTIAIEMRYTNKTLHRAKNRLDGVVVLGYSPTGDAHITSSCVIPAAAAVMLEEALDMIIACNAKNRGKKH